MYLEYSYGLLGYFFKYFGALGFIILTAGFSAIPIGIIVLGFYKIQLFGSIFLLIISFIMIPACLKGTYYFFRFRDSFTKKYLFSNSKIIVEGSNNSDTYHFVELEKIIYFKYLKTFELYFKKDNTMPIVIMNNGQHESQEFIELKQLLYNINIVVQERII